MKKLICIFFALAQLGLADRIVPQAIEAYGAIFAAARGETLQFADDYTYDVATGTGLLLPYKPGTGYVNIRSSLSLAQGQRVQLTDATHMPVFTTRNGNPVLGFNENSNYYDFDGIKLQSLSTLGASANYGLVVAAPSSITHTTTISNLPHDIRFHHIIARGREDGANNTTYNQSPGLLLDVNNGLVEDSNVTNFDNTNGTTGEANAVLVRIGNNVSLLNNELSSQGECVMLLAHDAYTPSESLQVTPGNGLWPSNIKISGNYIYKPYSQWYAQPATKNLVECKTCQTTEIDHNLFEYSFSGSNDVGQHGIAIVANSRNAYQSNSAPGTPWAPTQFVNIHDNIVHHAGGVFQVANITDDAWDCPTATGCPNPSTTLTNDLASGLAHRNNNVNIHDNFADDISGPVYNQTDPYIGLGMRGMGPDNFTFQRNTIIFRESAPGVAYGAGSAQGVAYSAYTTTDANSASSASVGTNGAYYTYSPLYGFSYVNQIFDSNTWSWQGKCDGAGVGTGCFTQLPGSTTLANITFTNNLQQNATMSAWSSLTTLNTTYPGRWANNTFNMTHAVGQGAPVSTLLAGECAIRTGNRSGISCTNPTVPTY